MKSIIRKLLTKKEQKLGMKLSGEEQLKRQVTAVYGLLANLMGSDKLVMKAGKLDALHLMRSDRLEERVLALKKIVLEDPTLSNVPKPEDPRGTAGD